MSAILKSTRLIGGSRARRDARPRFTAFLAATVATSLLSLGCAVDVAFLPSLPTPPRNILFVIFTQALPNGFSGGAYSAFIETQGGVNPMTSCQVVAGMMPGGLTIAPVATHTPQTPGTNLSACQISGTITTMVASGTTQTFTFTIRIDDNSLPRLSDSRQFTIIVQPGFQIVDFTAGTNTFGRGTEGRAFLQVVDTTLGGGRGNPPLQPDPNGCTATGLPAGLSISRNPANMNQCRITGMPALGSAGTYMVTLTFVDTPTVSSPMGNSASLGPLTLVINPPLTAPAFVIGNGTVGQPFSQSIPSAGGNMPLQPDPTGCVISGGGLPAGLMFGRDPANTSNCLISGNPTAAGPFNITITFTDTASSTTAAGSATSASTPGLINATLVITSGPALLDGVQNRMYNLGLTNTGGQSPFTWSNPGGGAASLNTGDPECAGLTLDMAGNISGTSMAAAPGTCSFSATVTATATTSTASFSVTAMLTIDIRAPLTATLTQGGNATPNVALLDGVDGQSYGIISAGAGAPTYTATGGTGAYSWCITSGGAALTGFGFAGISTNCAAQTPGAVVTLTAAVVTGNGFIALISVQLSDAGNAAVAGAMAPLNNTSLNIQPAMIFTVNVGTQVGTTVTNPDGSDNRPYGPSVADMTRMPLLYTAAGGLTAVGYVFTVTGNPAFLPCTTSATQVRCDSGGLAIPDGSAGAYPYTVAATNGMGNAAVPPQTITLNATLNVTDDIALVVNQADPLNTAVENRTYGTGALTPVQYTASGGLGSYTFSTPATSGVPAAAFPNGFACVTVVAVFTCSAASVTGAPGMYMNIPVTADDTSNATTPGASIAGAAATALRTLTVAGAIAIGVNQGDPLNTAVRNRAYGTAGFTPVQYTASGGLGGYSFVVPANSAVPAAAFPTGFACVTVAPDLTCSAASVTGAAGFYVDIPISADDTGNPSTPSASASMTVATVLRTLLVLDDLSVSVNVGTGLGPFFTGGANLTTNPNGVDGRPYGFDPVTNPGSVHLIYTPAGGVGPQSLSHTAPAFLGCTYNVVFPRVECNSAGLPIPLSTASGSPYLYTLTISDAGGVAVPGGSVTVNATLNVLPALAIMTNPAVDPPPASASGRTYGVGVGFTPLTYTAVGGTGGYMFTTPASVAAPAVNGVPAPMACVAGVTVVTCSSATGITAASAPAGLAYPFAVTVIDVANATTPAAAAPVSTVGQSVTNFDPLALTPNAAVDPPPLAVMGRTYGNAAAGFTPLTYTASGGLPGTGFVLPASIAAPGTGVPQNVVCSALAVTVTCTTGAMTVTAGAGLYNFTVTATDPGNASTPAGMAAVARSVTVRIPLDVDPAFAFTTWTLNVPFSESVPSVGGLPPLLPDTALPTPGCTAMSLPAGVGIMRDAAMTANCLVSGTPTAAGTVTVTINMIDTANATTPSGAASGMRSLTVAGGLGVSAFAFPVGVQARAFSTHIRTTGGNGNLASCSAAVSNSGGPVAGGLTTLGLQIAVAQKGNFSSLGNDGCRITNVAAGSVTGAAGSPYMVTITVVQQGGGNPAPQATSAAVTLNINTALNVPAFTLEDGKQSSAFFKSVPLAGGNLPVSMCTQTGLVAGLGTAVDSVTPDPNACMVNGNPTATATNAAVTLTGTDTNQPDPFHGTATGTNGVPAGMASGGANLTVNAALAISSGAPAGATVAVLYSHTFTRSGGTGPTFTWSLVSADFTGTMGNLGTPCEGFTFTAGTPAPDQSQLAGTPVNPGMCNFTITVMDTATATTAQSTVMAMQTVNVSAAPLSIAAITIGNGTEGRAVGTGTGGVAAVRMAITGGVAPYTCSDPGGTLPAGVTVVLAVTGTHCELNGAPAAASQGVYMVDITVTDSAPTMATTGTMSWTVNAALGILQGTGLPDGVAGRTYNLTLTPLGGQPGYTWALVAGSTFADDTDCDGLTFNAAGDIGGMTTGAFVDDGTCDFDAEVTDTATTSTMAGSFSRNFLTLVAGALTAPTGALSNALNKFTYLPTGGPGAVLMPAGGTGAPYTWDIISGNFTLNTGTGMWEGDVGTPCEGLSFPQTGIDAGSGNPIDTIISGVPVNFGICGPFDLRVTDLGSGPAPSGSDTGTLSIRVLRTLAYAAGSGTGSVEIIDTDTNVFVTFITPGVGDNGGSPDQVALSLDGSLAIVTMPNTDEVAIIDTVTNTAVAGSPFDISADCTAPSGVATTNLIGIGPRAYVACSGSDNAVAIDLDPTSGNFGTVVANIGGLSTSGTGTPQRVAFDPSGQTAVITISGTDEELAAIDATTDTLDPVSPVQFVDTSSNPVACDTPMGLAFSPIAQELYVVCSNAGFGDIAAVVVIDTDDTSGTFTQVLAKTTAIGTTGAAVLDSVAFTPDGVRAYVTVPAINQLSFITTSTRVVTNGFSVPDPTTSSGNTTPLGITIPPLLTVPVSGVELFITMSGVIASTSPGVAVINDNGGAPSSGTNNPIGPSSVPPFTAASAPRGIAHVPIPN